VSLPPRLPWQLYASSFITTGLAGVVGITAPGVQDDLQVGYVAIGALFCTQTLGAFLGAGSVAAMPTRSLSLSAAAAVTAGAIAIGAAAPRYWVLLPVMFVAGFAGFTLVTRAQAELSRLAGKSRGHALSRQHVTGAIGGTVYPLAFSGLLATGLDWRSGFALLAATYVLYWASLGRGCIGDSRAIAAPGGSRGGAAPVVWAVAVPALGVGIQTTIPLWLPTLLRDSFGASEAAASAGAGVYFFAVLAGRVSAARFLGRLGEARELTTATGLVLAGYALLAISPSAAAATGACAVIGFGVGPLLPLGVSRAVQAMAADRLASSLVMAMGCVAQILLPIGVVALLWALDLHAALCATALAAALMFEAVRRSAPPLASAS